MRRGYWRTLIRQLRDKVACGENAFPCDDQFVTIARVVADADIDPPQSPEVLLAYDSQGDSLVLDTTNSAVLLTTGDGAKRTLAKDLIAFVDALTVQTLRAHAQPDLALGDAMDEPLEFTRPSRGILDD